MEAADDASHESASSGSSMDFQFNLNHIRKDKHNQETSANSSNDLLEPGPNQPQQYQQIITPGPSSIAVGLGPRVHSHHQIYHSHPNSGVGNFSRLGDLSLSLNMGFANPYRSNAQLSTHEIMNVHNSNPNITHPPLFFDQNWAATATLNPRLQASGQRGSPFPDVHVPQYHSAMPYRPQQFSYYPYSNISDQPAHDVDDPRGRDPVYHLGARLQFPPTHLPRLRKNEESHEGSSNEVATSLASCSISHTSQQHHHLQTQVQETSKSSEEKVPDQPAAPRFNHMIRKRARNGAPKQWLIGESLPPSKCIKGAIGNGRMKNQSTHAPPLIALHKNPSDDRVTNSVYDIMFEEVGLPIDPHLRLFIPL